MLDFFSGAIMMASAASGLFFFKSWRATGDSLFLLFAMAFWVLAIERCVLATVSPANEFRFYVYTLRMAAFVLIAIAIVHKNRG